jgi:ribonucleoside-triphosphate reductase
MYTKLMDDYLSNNDWRVKENSNISHTYGGLVNYISSSVMAKYWLEKYYNKEINDAHTNCDMHIHDLGYFCGYCNGIDLRTILLKGVSGVRGQTSSCPPNHFESALNMALTMLMLLQSEFAGAQAYSNFDTLLAPYIKKDKLTYEQVYQLLQNFVWSLNYPTRLGAQAPFTNLTFDVKVPKSYKKDYPFIGKDLVDFTYEECQEEMNMINKAFMAIMVKGDSNGKGFPYPIPTYSITKDFDWDNPVLDQLFEMAGIYGIPYFQNLVNSSLNPEDIRSMCCRLSLDLTELRNMGGGLFGAEAKTGSIGVVTINLARIGYTSKNKNEFFTRLEYLLNTAKDSLETKRTVVTEWMDKGLYPYTKEYVGSFRTFFSTIGVNGGNEMCMNFLGKDITTEEGKEFSLMVLDFIRDKIKEFQITTGHLYNLEQTPAESTAGRFARKDRKLYPEMIIPGGTEAYYTNSTHIPVDKTTDVFDVFETFPDKVGKFCSVKEVVSCTTILVTGSSLCIFFC